MSNRHRGNLTNTSHIGTNHLQQQQQQQAQSSGLLSGISSVLKSTAKFLYDNAGIITISVTGAAGFVLIYMVNEQMKQEAGPTHMMTDAQISDMRARYPGWMGPACYTTDPNLSVNPLQFNLECTVDMIQRAGTYVRNHTLG